MPEAWIESLDHEARGITHVAGKAVFVDGALPLEQVEFSPYKRKASYELANLSRVVAPSPFRVAPRCEYFSVCGGCSMQHLDATAQTAVKQRVLEDALWHIGRVRAEVIYPALQGNAWGYRHRARLGVRRVVKKGGVLIGFREKRSSYITDMRNCHILPRRVAALLPRLRELAGALSIADRLPQIEVAVGDSVCALVLRILAPLSAADEELLRDFAREHEIRLYLQPGGTETVAQFYPSGGPALSYSLPDYDVRIEFGPTDFTQINPALNRVLVRRAIALLDPRSGECVADMFCGLGNFALPIAKCGADVVGVEGNPGLVDKAGYNAALNGLAERARFVAVDLFELEPETLERLGRFDKMLLDPPREGAMALVKGLRDPIPARIVYVSCNPATLARDAAVLHHQLGYRLRGAGVANMFPHTSHVESIAMFERQ